MHLRFTVALLAAAAFFGAAARLSAQAPQELIWEGDLEKAFARAKTEKKPLLVCMHKDKEIACTRMIALYADPKVKEKLGEFVLVATNLSEHKMVKAKVGAEDRETCPHFKGITCAQHIAAEQKIRDRFLASNTVTVPQHMVVDAAADKMVLTKVYELKKAAFLAYLDRGKLAFAGISEDQIDEQTKALFGIVKNGKAFEKEKAVKAVLEYNSEPKTRLLRAVVDEIEDESDRVACIRAMGYEQFPHAGVALIEWLKDESILGQNSAVVSLEETRASAGKELVDLWGKAKDAELKKDIARALGPCAPGEKEAKTILMGLLKSTDEKLRQAAYMSLGAFTADEEAKKAVLEGYRKEKDFTLKTAVIYGFMTSRDVQVVKDLETLQAEEKNNQLKLMIQKAIDRLQGKADEPGGRKGFRSMVKPLFAKDKIVRNQVKEWDSYR